MARILILALGVGSPGGWRHLEGFLPALRDRAAGHRFDLMTQTSGLEVLRPTAGGPVELIPVSDRVARSVLPRLWMDLCVIPLRAKRRGYDLVVTLANFGPVWCPVPHLVVQQNVMPFAEEFLARIGARKRAEWRLRARLCFAEMRFATLNVTPSDALADQIRSVYPSLARKPFRTLFHGADLSRFSPRAEGGARGDGPFIFLCPSRVEAYKGLEILLEAVHLLADGRSDFEVHVTTDDHGWPATVQRAIEDARAKPSFERVRFIGSQPSDRMPDLYRSTDALVYPSLCESFGFPLLEAMACGLPTVAGDLAINRELCEDAADYYELKSAAACAGAMRRMLDDDDHRRRLRDGAARRIRARDWSWGTYAARFVELCELAMAD